jgi:hypothetical protein
MTLRYMAGGAVVDIIDLHGVSEPTFYRCLWQTVDALNHSEWEGLQWPSLSDQTYLRDLEADFSALSDGSMRGCMGALDGLQIKIRKPHAGETQSAGSFFSRKGFFGVNAQVRTRHPCVVDVITCNPEPPKIITSTTLTCELQHIITPSTLLTSSDTLSLIPYPPPPPTHTHKTHTHNVLTRTHRCFSRRPFQTDEDVLSGLV